MPSAPASATWMSQLKVPKSIASWSCPATRSFASDVGVVSLKALIRNSGASCLDALDALEQQAPISRPWYGIPMSVGQIGGRTPLSISPPSIPPLSVPPVSGVPVVSSSPQPTERPAIARPITSQFIRFMFRVLLEKSFGCLRAKRAHARKPSAPCQLSPKSTRRRNAVTRSLTSSASNVNKRSTPTPSTQNEASVDP